MYCCVDIRALSLPPTLALTLDASGCLPPFEMLIDFSVQNSKLSSSSVLHLSAHSFVSCMPSFIAVSPFHKHMFTWQHRNSSNKRPGVNSKRNWLLNYLRQAEL